jgi:hypothetical protein
VFGSGLIQCSVLFGEPDSFFFSDAAEKRVHSGVPAARTVVEMREHRELIAVIINRLESGAGLVFRSCLHRKEAAWPEAKVISNTKETPWIGIWCFIGPRCPVQSTLKDRQGQRDSRTLKKVAAIHFVTCLHLYLFLMASKSICSHQQSNLIEMRAAVKL